MANPLAVTLHALAAVSAGGSAPQVDICAGLTDERAFRTAARLTLEVSVLSPGAQLAVTVETSPDGTNWRSADTFPTFTAAGQASRAFAKLQRYVRVSWTLSGATPTAVFEVKGQAHQIFMVPEDVSMSELRDKALQGIPAYVQANCCIIASGAIETALAEFTPPILSIGEKLRQSGIAVAAYYMLKWRGFSAEGPDQLVLDEKELADKYIKDVADGKVDPDVDDSESGEAEPLTFAVDSLPRRGW